MFRGVLVRSSPCLEVDMQEPTLEIGNRCARCLPGWSKLKIGPLWPSVGKRTDLPAMLLAGSMPQSAAANKRRQDVEKLCPLDGATRRQINEVMHVSDNSLKPGSRRPVGQQAATPFRPRKASRTKTPSPPLTADLSLPHERDESTDTTAVQPDPVIKQAKRDIDAGLVDTDMWATPGLDAERRRELVPGPGGKR